VPTIPENLTISPTQDPVSPGYHLPPSTSPPPQTESHYPTPEELVRRRAIERAELRRRRLEAQRMMGYSPLRPTVTAMPYTTTPPPRRWIIVMPVVVEKETPATGR
jgi:hypothetical protein